MARVLTADRLANGTPELVTAAHLDESYRHLTNCDPELDIALIEQAGRPGNTDTLAAYCRPVYEHLGTGTTDLVVFAPIDPGHLDRSLFDAIVRAEEAHLRTWLTADVPARYRARAGHGGPGTDPTGPAAWLEELGYLATEWDASLRRPHLDDIPDLTLPDGIEVRAVRPEQLREIVAAHFEAFRGEWGFSEPDERSFSYVLDDPNRDETLWQVAWDGDVVVGQVKPFINPVENQARGYRRGYTEFISTHHDYRNRGIAGALLARALRAVRDRGMTEAVLGVDTNNPGGAFQLYRRLGFEVESYEAVYTRDVGPDDEGAPS